MRALINNQNPEDVMTEDTWLDWFGPNGEGLIARFDYRLVEFDEALNAEPVPAPQRTEDPRISQLEAEIAAIREGRA